MQASGDAWREELERRKTAVALAVEERILLHGTASDLLPFPSATAAADIAAGAQCKATQVERYVVTHRARWLGPTFPCDARLYFMLHKPRGVSSMRTQGGNTAYDVLPPGFPPLPHVGRLDKQSEGLLLFTDDGRLAHALIDGTGNGDDDEGEYLKVSKVYCVQTAPKTTVDETALASLRLPLELANGKCSRAARDVRVVSPEDPEHSALSAGSQRGGAWVRVAIDEGKKHHVRRLMARARVPVRRLVRVSLGPLELGSLQPGDARALTCSEVEACYLSAHLDTCDAPFSLPLPWPKLLGPNYWQH